MFNIKWDIATGGVQLTNQVTSDTLGISPRPVFFEELDLLGLDKLGWEYQRCQEPLLWAVNKQYFYRGELVFEAKGANLYDAPTIVFTPGKERLTLQPVDVAEMIRRNQDFMFLLESEAIEFIRDVFVQYSAASKSVESVKANQIDFEALKEKIEKRTKTKMAIVREDCNSFDIMPLEEAYKQGKREYKATKIDYFIASFSGGKDSQVILDLCTRAIPSTDFQVIYSDTGYELPPSLDLYEKVKAYYGERFPKLKFTLARNHESVLNYWDKIGTPSDTHRWCCTVMKTAPLYRNFKLPGTSKQAKVMAFDGVRAEESLRRESYERKGPGKHTNIINAHPILHWNTVEIFLYLLEYAFPINPAYRLGKARVGCLVCPFSTSWDDMICHRAFQNDMLPFVKRLNDFSARSKISDISTFIKDRKWKIRSLGSDEILLSKVSFSLKGKELIAKLTKPQRDVLEWLPALGKLSVITNKNISQGEIAIKKDIIPFTISRRGQDVECSFLIGSDREIEFLLKRVLYKATQCIQCEACEVECPTGALTIFPKLNIDQEKCIHCLKCVKAHDRGCIVADSIRMVTDSDLKTIVKGYKKFGIREEWLEEFFIEPSAFFIKDKNHKYQNSLGAPQNDGLKDWLKEADLIDEKEQLTEFGFLLSQIWKDNPTLVWEVLWVNLCYNSAMAHWFSANVPFNHLFTLKPLSEALVEQGLAKSSTTALNSVTALGDTLKKSPIGSDLCQFIQEDKLSAVRQSYNDISLEAVAYSIYKYAKSKDQLVIRLSELFSSEEMFGLYREFGISQDDLKKKLRALSSDNNRVLIAELNMGLDHITLKEEYTPLTALQQLLS